MLSFVVAPNTVMAFCELPETTFPAPAADPPIVLPVAPPVTLMPLWTAVFGSAAVPAAVRPM